MTEIARVFVGFDEREAIVYHTFCQSVLERSSVPVSFVPLNLGWKTDGSNAFTLSRYLVPQLCNFDGWALFFDGDMICDADIEQIASIRNDKAVSVVQHDYKTKHRRKMVGSKMEAANADYPRKNWSSVVLWNCGHPSNRILTSDYVREATSAHLHRFEWLNDSEIGTLPEWWNHLVDENAPAAPSLYHFTLGVPALEHYADCFGSWKWHAVLTRALQCGGETPSEIVKRAEDRVGECVDLERGAAA